MEEQTPETVKGAGAVIHTGELAALDDQAFVDALRAAHDADEITLKHLIEWERRPADLLADEPDLAAALHAQRDSISAAMRGAMPTTELFDTLRGITANLGQPFAEIKGWAEQFNSVKIPNPVADVNWAAALGDTGEALRPFDAIKLMADPHLEASNTLIDVVDLQRSESAAALGVITEILARQEAAGATAERINKWMLAFTLIAAIAAVAGLVVAIVAL